MYLQEGAADAAKLVLARYDPATDSFTDDSQSRDRPDEFWDAVALAHAAGQKGAGRTVAVIDTAFDLSLPALAEQHLAWPQDPDARTSHGTAVALLIHHVAPEARLELYPVGVGDRLDEDLLTRAVTETTADVVNLSLGTPHPLDELLDLDRITRDAEEWPDLQPEDVPFWLGEAQRTQPRWREWLRPTPTSPLDEAVLAAVARGVTVVAACGNKAGQVFSPALLEGVVAASFQRVSRTVELGGTEVAASVVPVGYSQAELSDFSLLQPPTTLGSSFAAPLIAGFAATMPDRSTLPRHAEAARLTTTAGELVPQLTDGVPGWERRWRVLNALYNGAMRATPHEHWRLTEEDDRPCPECALFAAPAYVDGGLHWLRSGYVDEAERVLTAVFRFAPRNPHAAANLGVTLAAQADRIEDVAERQDLLERAGACMRIAVRLRPEHAPYRQRAEEFEAASRDPASWRLHGEEASAAPGSG